LNDAELAGQLIRLAHTATEHAIVLLDLDGNVTWWSPGATKLFSIEAQDAIGMPFRSIFTEQDQDLGIHRLEMAIAQADAVSEDDRWHRRADGSQFWSTGALEPIHDAAGTLIGYGKILRDRTNLAEQFAFLHARIDQAKGVANDYAATIAKMSHEIRNTLAALTSGLSQMERFRLDEEKRRHVTRLMKSQMEVLSRLSEDLLAASHDRNEKALVKTSRVGLQALIREILDGILPPRIANRQMEVLAPAVPIEVDGDRARLLRVFGNLLDNAIKYTHDDGRIWIKITVEVHEAVVHIEDDGRGVPPDMLSKIFNLFTRVDANSPAAGFGVGLAIVHEVVLLHGGCVQARSEGLDRGSIFTVRLPLAAPSK
jgi:PAS domain S-box-containing protein